MRAPLLLPLMVLAGCAWEAGEGFAVLEPTVRAAYAPEAPRDAGDGYQRLSSDYQVRVTAATMRLEGIELIARSGGGGSGGFDPSNPPPGYGLCHNGHCHRDDGALIPYEEIEAETGGGATARTVVTLPVGEVDLLSPETRAVECTPACELPRGEVSRGRWAVTAVRLEGTVRDGRAPPRFPGERPFRLVFTPARPTDEPFVLLDGDLDVPVNRAHAPRVLLDLRLDVTSRIFDPVAWETTEPGSDGTVDLLAPANAPVLAVLQEQLSELSPTAEVSREDR